eukprot:scaffold27640_cov84-Skeletonema_dohrnii-CCMP3373.AAC.5
MGVCIRHGATIAKRCSSEGCMHEPRSQWGGVSKDKICNRIEESVRGMELDAPSRLSMLLDQNSRRYSNHTNVLQTKQVMAFLNSCHLSRNRRSVVCTQEQLVELKNSLIKFSILLKCTTNSPPYHFADKSVQYTIH